jgi:cyclophilin family peptidyl-prolyl cis-trans isomerase
MRVSCLLVVVLLATVPPARAEEPPPRLGPERIILTTPAGDVVLALYPDVAPRHGEQVLRLVRLGVYDSTHFSRIEPGFVAQLSTALDRTTPLTEEQRAAIHPLAAEFSTLHHRRGVLSMAHVDGDPDSGETSFSVLLGEAPHLDGKYTVFGQVESGMEVFDEMLNVPRNGTAPVVRLEVRKARVVDSPEALLYLDLAEAHPVPVPAALVPQDAARSQEMAGGIALMVLCGLGCFFLAHRLPGRVLLSLNLIVVLVGSFLLFMILVPAAQTQVALAVVLFLGVLGVLKLMSRFESPA